MMLSNEKFTERNMILQQDGLKNSLTLDQEQSDILRTAIIMMENDLEKRLRVLSEEKSDV
jgi:hypothetical protein